MTILREWRAYIRRARRDEYVQYVKVTGIREYLSATGNLGASIGTRDIDDARTEIVVLSWWADREAIRAFAGDDIACARYFPEDDAFLLSRPTTVDHYECKMFTPG